MYTGGINGGIEMCLDEMLRVVDSEYKVMCNGKELDNTEKLDEKKLSVESIAVIDGVIHI